MEEQQGGAAGAAPKAHDAKVAWHGPDFDRMALTEGAEAARPSVHRLHDPL